LPRPKTHVWSRSCRNLVRTRTKVRNLTLRTLVAEEFHASILEILRAARRFHTRAFVHLGDFQTTATKLRSRGRLLRAKVRNVIALRTLWTCAPSFKPQQQISCLGAIQTRPKTHARARVCVSDREYWMLISSVSNRTPRRRGRDDLDSSGEAYCSGHIRDY